MIEAAKAIINLLQKKGFEAFFIGGKCRLEIHNYIHSDNLRANNIDIITNAPLDNIKKIFPRNEDEDTKFNTIIIKFAGKDFLVTSFKKDKFNYEKVKVTLKSLRASYSVVGKLDERRKERDFTINTIVQSMDNKFIDFTYRDEDVLISAFKDIKLKFIRCIGDPDENFMKKPIRILRMFRLQSQLGYKIHSATMAAAIRNKNLLLDIPIALIGKEFNELLLGRHIDKAIESMKKFKLFDLMINNHLFMECINDVKADSIQQLIKYNHHGSSPIEAYSILLKDIDKDRVIDNLKAFMPIKEEAIEKVIWLMQHQELVDENRNINLRKKIFDSKINIVDENPRIYLLNLIRHVQNIVSSIYSKEEGKKIYDAFCERPYFVEQLRITREELIKFVVNEDDGEWVDKAIESILNRLVQVDDDKWPYDYKGYMEYVKLGILDVLPNAEVIIPEELIKVDYYNNVMDHHKAVQFVEEGEPSPLTSIEDYYKELEEKKKKEEQALLKEIAKEKRLEAKYNNEFDYDIEE